MSLTALLPAVADAIRSAAGLDQRECNIQPDDQPPPGMTGTRYVAICGGYWNPGIPVNDGLTEEFGVNVTATIRLNAIPLDRRTNNLYLEHLRAIEPLVRRIIVAVHLNWDIIHAADNVLGSTANPFTSPFTLQSCDARPRMVGAEWFWEDPVTTKVPMAGLVMSASFGGCQRHQSTTTLE